MFLLAALLCNYGRGKCLIDIGTEGSGEPVSVIALSLGYESESAFSTAFKRVMGCSPRQYSRGRNPASSAPARVRQLEPVAS